MSGHKENPMTTNTVTYTRLSLEGENVETQLRDCRKLAADGANQPLEGPVPRVSRPSHHLRWLRDGLCALSGVRVTIIREGMPDRYNACVDVAARVIAGLNPHNRKVAIDYPQQ
jgi:hypothetical protein